MHFFDLLPLALASPGESGGGGGGFMFVPLLFMMVIMYFLMIRPQQKRQKEHRNMLDSLGKGDRVITNGGLYANVLDVKEDRIVATLAEGVKVEIARSAVAAKVQAKGSGKNGSTKGKAKSKDKSDEAEA